ncbi:MAG TPA: hypothetical protein VFE51_30495 [Verrucomicrobiae bacterium]|nr:hypothetical protein [Verrucomicrobiae bacterium]
MRVLLQNTETKLFLIAPNDWTEDPLKATDFEQVENAAQVYHTQDLAYAQIVLEPGLPSAPPQLNEFLDRLQAQGSSWCR